MGARPIEDARARLLRRCPSRAVHGRTIQRRRACRPSPSTASTRRRDALEAVRRLRRGELRAIFTVDIFNEGVDIPEVDTILLLRPTESATVFLQQLGRGLRWAEGKSVLTVLDFIGQAHAEYRFDVRFRAMVGGTRRQVERAARDRLPAHAARVRDPARRDRSGDRAGEPAVEHPEHSARALIDDLRGCPHRRRLPQFLEVSSFDLPDVYSQPGKRNDLHLRAASGWAPARRAGPGEAEYAKALGRMLHVDDEERYAAWRRG